MVARVGSHRPMLFFSLVHNEFHIIYSFLPPHLQLMTFKQCSETVKRVNKSISNEEAFLSLPEKFNFEKAHFVIKYRTKVISNPIKE